MPGHRAPTFAIVASLAFLGCEGAPFNESKISVPNRVVSGQVQFDGREQAEDVYIWFQGFNLSTRSDFDGHFEFVLPPPALQGAAGGITGVFNIYYYTANFHIDSTEVALIQGNFVEPRGELNSDGKLNLPKVLRQRLKVKTTVQPTCVVRDAIVVTEGKTDFLMKIEVSLSAARDSVVVEFPREVDQVRGPLIFRNVETGDFKVLSSTITEFVTSDRDTIDSVPTVRTLALPLFPDDLSPGQYEVIPYILLDDVRYPAGLIESLGPDIVELGEGYLSLPFLRQGAARIFTVQ